MGWHRAEFAAASPGAETGPLGMAEPRHILLQGWTISRDQSENLYYLHRLLMQCFVRGCAVEPEAAGALAHVVVTELRALAGGDDLYIPAAEKHLRDEAIRREFNGRNIEEVRKKYGLSRSQVYRIANRRRS